MAPRKKQSGWADTAEQIKASRTMDVTLLSGAKVTLRTVTLDELAMDDAIPGDLVEVAILDSADLLLPSMLEAIRGQKPEEAQRLSRNAVLLADRVAKRALVAPAGSDDVIEALDGFDKKMILEIAQRKRSVDAAGKVVAAQALADFAGFRDVAVGAEGGGVGGEDGEVADAVA